MSYTKALEEINQDLLDWAGPYIAPKNLSLATLLAAFDHARPQEARTFNLMPTEALELFFHNGWGHKETAKALRSFKQRPQQPTAWGEKTTWET